MSEEDFMELIKMALRGVLHNMTQAQFDAFGRAYNEFHEDPKYVGLLVAFKKNISYRKTERTFNDAFCNS